MRRNRFGRDFYVTINYWETTMKTTTLFRATIIVLLFAFALSNARADSDIDGIYEMTTLFDDGINPPKTLRAGFAEVQTNGGVAIVTVLPIKLNSDYLRLKWFALGGGVNGNQVYATSLLSDASQGWIIDFTGSGFNAVIDYCNHGPQCGPYAEGMELTGVKVW